MSIVAYKFVTQLKYIKKKRNQKETETIVTPYGTSFVTFYNEKRDFCTHR